MEPKRLIEIDVLRTVAILLIVFCHLYYAVPLIADSDFAMSIEVILAICGLCLFFFLSGYSLMLKDPSFNGFKDLRSYLGKRFVRIYPLYWIALLLIILTRIPLGPQPFIGWDILAFSDLQKIITVAGLQILFVPTMFGDATLWFVSAIVMFYLIFPVLIYSADRIRKQSVLSILVVAAVIFILLASVKVVFDTIDKQLFLYYWFFVLGIVIKVKWHDISKVGKPTLAAGMLLSVAGLAFLVTVRSMAFHLPSQADWAIYLISVGMLGISVAVLLTNLLKRYVVNRINNFVRRTALSTYSIFLFSVYFMYAIGSLASGLDPVITLFAVLLIGVPLAVFFPKYIQDAVDWVVSHSIKRLKSIIRWN